jgi:hypothetical protein
VGVHLGLGLWIDHAAGAGVLGTVSLYAYLAIGLGRGPPGARAGRRAVIQSDAATQLNSGLYPATAVCLTP